VNKKIIKLMNKNKFFKNNILGVVKRNPLFLHEIE